MLMVRRKKREEDQVDEGSVVNIFISAFGQRYCFKLFSNLIIEKNTVKFDIKNTVKFGIKNTVKFHIKKYSEVSYKKIQ